MNFIAPTRIAAVDAGSNAIRLEIAAADSPNQIIPLATERCAVRLGHLAFTQRRFDRRTLSEAARAFRQFRALMDRYGVEHYRAVATSAAREARNRSRLIRRIRQETGIRLEVIDSAEEARLVRSAVLPALGQDHSPRLIADLGGGSLEISLLQGPIAERTIAFPLGTVRLMETYGISGAFTEDSLDRMQRHVLSLLESFWPAPPDLSSVVAVACGGNAETLARLAAGPRVGNMPTLNLRLLSDRLWSVLRLGIPERMKTFGVSRNRAEVMGIAAIVFTALGERLGLRSLLVPGVGVREGVLQDLAAAHFRAVRARPATGTIQPLLRHARRLAARFHCDPAHAEQVRRLVTTLFDKLAALCDLVAESRLVLELAALLHDAGYAVNPQAHHKHGEYLVNHAPFPGLSDAQRVLVACLVRYHGRAEPDPGHKLYSTLSSRHRRQLHALLALLRLAVALDYGRTQTVSRLEVLPGRKRISLRLYTGGHPGPPAAVLRNAARLFEQEFDRKIRFRFLRDAPAELAEFAGRAHQAA